jgi:hypothetical protein
MAEPAPKAELLRALGRLVRGLSALFWGLPTAFIVCYYTAKAEALKSFGVVPPLATTALLVFGLWQLGDFQKQERVWRNALDRTTILSLFNFGLSPFLYWYYRVPGNPLFMTMATLMAFTALLFLASLNLAIQRLGAMLPDETLRLETSQFTVLNINLVFATLVITGGYLALGQLRTVPLWAGALLSLLERGNGNFWFLILLVLLPLAMTMALLWKTKEVILDSVFSAER